MHPQPVSGNSCPRVFSFFSVAALSVLIAAFLFAAEPVFAQADVVLPQVETAAEQAVVQPQPAADETALFTQAPSEEAAKDAQVRPEELGASASRVLPDSPLYALKRFGRGISETFTFDPIKKAELRLRHASQELVDAGALIEKKSDDPSAVAAAQQSIERFEKKVQKVQETALGGQDTRSSEKDQLADRFFDNQIKQQKILENMQSEALHRVPKDIAKQLFERIETTKRTGAEAAGNMLLITSQDPAALAERVQRVFDNQQGSEFKTIRNIEIFRQMKESMPEEARAAMGLAEEHALQQFAEQWKEQFHAQKLQRFEQYVRSVGGNETIHLQTFDQLSQVDGLPSEMRSRLDSAKTISSQRLQDRLEAGEKFDEQFRGAIQERLFRPLNQHSDGIGNLRVLDEVRNRVQFTDKKVQQEIEKQHEAAIEKFKAQFPENGDDAEKFKALSKSLTDNPDPTTFRLIKELEDRVKSDPAKRAFIEQMEREARETAKQYMQFGDEERFQKFPGMMQDMPINPQEFDAFVPSRTHETFVPTDLPGREPSIEERKAMHDRMMNNNSNCGEACKMQMQKKFEETTLRDTRVRQEHMRRGAEMFNKQGFDPNRAPAPEEAGQFIQKHEEPSFKPEFGAQPSDMQFSKPQGERREGQFMGNNQGPQFIGHPMDGNQQGGSFMPQPQSDVQMNAPTMQFNGPQPIEGQSGGFSGAPEGEPR